jgi:hypothetical protein
MRGLYLKATINSLQIRKATNLLANVAAATVFCLFENHMIGVFCTKMNMPLCEHLVMTLPAWLASTKADIVTDVPVVWAC